MWTEGDEVRRANPSLARTCHTTRARTHARTHVPEQKYSYTLTKPVPETTRSTDTRFFCSNFSFKNVSNPNSNSLRGANSAWPPSLGKHTYSVTPLSLLSLPRGSRPLEPATAVAVVTAEDGSTVPVESVPHPGIAPGVGDDQVPPALPKPAPLRLSQ